MPYPEPGARVQPARLNLTDRSVENQPTALRHRDLLPLEVVLGVESGDSEDPRSPAIAASGARDHRDQRLSRRLKLLNRLVVSPE